MKKRAFSALFLLPLCLGLLSGAALADDEPHVFDAAPIVEPTVKPDPEPASDQPPAPSRTAYPTPQTVRILDAFPDEAPDTGTTPGRDVTFYCYALKDPVTGFLTNYVKLRDAAYAVNGTRCSFNVDWDGLADAIALTGGAYQPNGSEMIENFAGLQTYTPATAAVTMNGESVALDAITLTDAAGGGYTYVKLRDIGRAVGFNVSWQDGAVVIDTGNPYTDAD